MSRQLASHNNQVKRNSLVARSQSSRLPMVSFQSASEHMVDQGITTIASLKGDGEFPPEIECMAAEFKDALRGEISSVVSPMTLKLKDAESTSRVKIGNLEKVMAAIKGENYPFYRVDRLKILYIPLFADENCEGTITFSIQDTSMMVGGKPKDVKKATVPLNKMMMVELKAEYFIPRENIKMIEFAYKAKGVPVVGRAFGFVCCAFYIQKDYMPSIMKPVQPIVLMIEDIDVPVDINKTSSIKTLCDKVHKRIKENQREFNLSKAKNQVLDDRRRSTLLLTEDTSEKEEDQYEEEEVRRVYVKEEDKKEKGINPPVESMSLKKIIDYLPRDLPVSNGHCPILDTGAPDHWMYHPSLTELEEDNKVDNLVENRHFYRLKGVEVKLGPHWVRLREVLYGRGTGMPLISYMRLNQAGTIDSVKTFNESRSSLCKDGKVIFHLDSTGSYMVFEPSSHSSSIMLLG